MQYRYRCTDIRQCSHSYPVGHGESLGQISHGGAHFSVRAAILADNHLRCSGIRFFDIDRKLQSFFIIPHLLTHSFPRPGLHDPIPALSAVFAVAVQCERTEAGCIFFQKLFPERCIFTKISHSIVVVRVGIQIKSHVVHCETDLVNHREKFRLRTGTGIFHRLTPRFPQNGLQSSGKIVPMGNALHKSKTVENCWQGT